MQNVGTSMLEDGIFTTDKWIKNTANQATAKKFLAASLQGWIYCRDHSGDCVKIVLANGPALPKGHQTWQMNEINALIWPAPKGIGIMDPAAYERSAKIVEDVRQAEEGPRARGLPHRPRRRRRVAMLKAKGLDVNGKNWKKATSRSPPGGK